MSADPKIDALKLMRELVDLVDFWRRGDEPFRLAAVDLEKVLKKNLAESYWPLVTQVLREREEAQTQANSSC